MSGDEITLEELSERTGVEARTLRSWVSEGLLSPPFKAGRGARYPASNADRALAVRALKDLHGLSLAEIGRRFMMATEDQIREWAIETGPTSAPRGTARDYLSRIQGRGIKPLSAPKSMDSHPQAAFSLEPKFAPSTARFPRKSQPGLRGDERAPGNVQSERRREPRQLAAPPGAVLPALLFPATGLFKLLVGQLPSTPLPAPPTLATAALTAVPFTEADGAIREAVAVPVLGATPVWRVVAPRGEALNLWLAEADGTAIHGDDEVLARRIASGALGKPVSDALTLVSAFDRDYGFANKRLPVWRAMADDGSGWYFETRSGVVAARVGGPDGALDRAQALVFNLLHKGHLLDPLGVTPNQRNIVMSALAASVVLAALFGVALRRRRAARTPEDAA